MARTTGIEIQENRVRLVVLETAGRKPKIAGFVEQPIIVAPDEERGPRVAAAIKEALQIAKAPRGRAVAEINTGDVVLRELTLPFTEMDQLRAVVPGELESFVHNYTIEDLVVDFYKTGELEKGSQVLAAAAPKKILKERLAILSEAAIDPVSVDLDVSGLFTALMHTGAIDTDDPFLILHGTPKFTKLIFVEGKRPKSIRTIRFSLPRPGEIKSELPPDPSRELQTTELPGPVPIVVLTTSQVAKFSDLDFETRSSLMEILAKEISRFLLANAAAATPSHMLVTGEFEDDESAALLEAATKIPTKTFPLLESVEHSFHKDELGVQSRLAVPIGLALKAGGVDPLGMDFRKGEFSFKKKFESVKTTALVTIELVIVFLAALALHFYYRAGDIRDIDLAELHRRQAEIYEAVFNGGKPSSPERSYEELRSKLHDLSEKVGETGDFPLKQTGLLIAGQLYKTLMDFQRLQGGRKQGDQDLWVEIGDVQVSQDATPDRKSFTVTLDGLVANDDWAQILLAAIKKDGLFADAEWDKPLTPFEGKIRFRIKATKQLP